MSRLTLRAALTKLALVSLTVFALVFCCIPSARAAEADVIAFNVYREGTPVKHRIAMQYTAQWDTNGLYCDRNVDWYVNSSLSSTLSSIDDIHIDTTSPYEVNENLTKDDVWRAEGTGNYYKIVIGVQRLIPFTVYASDEATDAEFDS